MKRFFHLGILIPGIIVSALLSIRMCMEIWQRLPYLSGERLTGYFALVFVSTAAWLILSHIFVDMAYDNKT